MTHIESQIDAFQRAVISSLISLCDKLSKELSIVSGSPYSPAHRKASYPSFIKQLIEEGYYVIGEGRTTPYYFEYRVFRDTLERALQHENLSLEETEEIVNAIIQRIKSRNERRNVEIWELEDKIQTQAQRIAELEEKLRRCSTCPFEDGATEDCQTDPSNDFRCFLRSRKDRQQAYIKSDIDLYEDFDDSRRNKFGLQNTNIVDFVMIVQAMYDLGMFTKFDDSIENNKESLKKQERADLKSVFHAFGGAVNIPELGQTYNSYYQQAKRIGLNTVIFEVLEKAVQKRANKK